jgi:thiol:disulfide interchange protein DsbD
MHINKLITLLILLFAAVGATALQNIGVDDLLSPDQAFQIRGWSEGPDQLVVEWRIADGYYMYRDKIHFETDTPGIQLNHAMLPPGEIKHDEFFGDVAIYRGSIRTRIPFQRDPGAADTISLQARSQGCADLGICFPPHVQEILLALEPAAAPAISELEPLPETGLAELLDKSNEPPFGAADDEILTPEQAYQLSAVVEDGNHLRLLWNIAEGTYLYHDKIKLELLDASGVAIGDYVLPEPEIKQNSVRPDGSIGDVAVHHQEIDLKLPLLRSNTGASDIILEAAYQGCAERGICYPPIRKQFNLSLPAISQAAAAELPPQAKPAAPAAPPSPVGEEPLSEVDQITATLQGGSFPVILGGFFLLGLGLAFTPCIFPMIPILSGIIVGQGQNITTRKAFVLSLVYVLAMALTYTIAGVLAGLFGGNLQAAFQNPWILSGFAAVFVLLALSMFGFYDLQLPSSLQGKLTEISNRQQGGTLLGVAIMGLLSALIVGPCVAPPLAGALIYIGQSGDAMLGGLALFALSMGMGTPLLVIGASAGKLLPRAGSWMDAVKAVFGVALLGVAIFLLERIIPADIAMLLWGILLIVSAIYMGALRHLEIEASGWQKLWKGVGVVFLVYGALMLVGAAAGGKDTLQPLRGIAWVGSGGTHGSQELVFQRIKTLADLQREVAKASARGQTVMLDFYADWCVSCKEMEKYTFSDPRVIAALQDTLLLQADVTANDAQDQALLQGHFGLPGPPAIMFYGKDGQERKNYRVVGFKPADEFAPHVVNALR